MAATTLVVGCSGTADEPVATSVATTSAPVPGQPIDDLVAGDCLSRLPRGRTDRAETVPCGRGHRAEVYAVHDFEVGPFPGARRLDAEAALRCADLYEGYAGEPVDPTTDRAFAELVPTAASWAQDDRRVVCLALPPAGGRERGSIADAASGPA